MYCNLALVTTVQPPQYIVKSGVKHHKPNYSVHTDAVGSTSTCQNYQMTH